mgnify:CR=1 FL=1
MSLSTRGGKIFSTYFRLRAPLRTHWAPAGPLRRHRASKTACPGATGPRKRPPRSHWASKTPPSEPLGLDNGPKTALSEPLGLENSCLGATGAPKKVASEPLGLEPNHEICGFPAGKRMISRSHLFPCSRHHHEAPRFQKGPPK